MATGEEKMKSDSVSAMPVLFVGHGSPMNAIEDNSFHRSWRELGNRLPTPRAVLCISAHWETRGVRVTASERPETIHDFSGFPRALFEVQYPAPGSPELARRTIELLAPEPVAPDTAWGLDHGAWSVLCAMYPEADVPVVQLSLDTARPAAFHYELAKRLAPLRREGVLVLGSGNVVHNLGVYRFGERTPYDWAMRWDEAVRRALLAGEHQILLAYEDQGPDARRSVPTPEHYFPLLYAAALQEPGESLQLFNTAVETSLSMTSVVVGGGNGFSG